MFHAPLVIWVGLDLTAAKIENIGCKFKITTNS